MLQLRVQTATLIAEYANMYIQGNHACARRKISSIVSNDETGRDRSCAYPGHRKQWVHWLRESVAQSEQIYGKYCNLLFCVHG